MDNIKILELIYKIAADYEINLIEAAVKFAAEHNMDLEDLIETFDDFTKEVLRQDAIENNMVRKCVAIKKKSVMDF
jgi:hypothetical protein